MSNLKISALVLALALVSLARPIDAEEASSCPPPGGVTQAPQPASLEDLLGPADRQPQMRFFRQEEQAVSVGTQVEDDSGEPTWPLKGALLPGFRSRFFRPFTLSVSRIDQLDSIFDGTINSETQEPNFTPNPAGDLDKVGLTIKPGSFLRSTAELKDAYAVALGDGTKMFVDRSSDPLQATPSGQKLHYLAWADSQGFGKRLLSAFEITVGYTERSPFAGAVLLDEEVRREDEEEGTYSATLDLDRFVVFPAEVAEAYETLEKHTMLNPMNRSGLDQFDSERCLDLDPIGCLRWTSGIRVKGRWLAGLLPKIQYQTKDQFDFILAGGEPFPFVEDALDTWTVTWDLGTALDTATHRRAALKALALHRELAARDGRRNLEPILQVDSIRLPFDFPAPIQLKAAYRGETQRVKLSGKKERKPAKVEWTLVSVESASGKKLNTPGSKVPVPKISSTGELSILEVEPGDYTLRLCLVDDVNNYSYFQQELELTVSQ